MVIYKIDRLYEAFVARAIDRTIDNSQDLQSSELEKEIAQWKERKQDAECASWQYLKLADKLYSLPSQKTKIRVMQGINFDIPMNPVRNNPIGRIFLNSEPDLSPEQVRQLACKEGWDIEHIAFFSDHISSPKGIEMIGKNKDNGRLLQVYLGKMGLEKYGLTGDLRDYAREFFGKLNPDLGIILE